MTAPARNATCNPSFRLLLAACVVRALALVAVRMPKYPQIPENNPPVRNAYGTILFCKSNDAMIRNIMNRTTNAIATTLYCRLRYAMAPSRTACAISRMRGVPSSLSITDL